MIRRHEGARRGMGWKVKVDKTKKVRRGRMKSGCQLRNTNDKTQ